MAIFKVEQYELWSQSYEVEASSKAEAIVKILQGQGEVLDNMLEYIQTCEDKGLRVSENQDLAQEVERLGILIDDVIPSIRDVELVEEDLEDNDPEDDI